ncbi:SDR family NAD(P)-dependent oxidoreductase [Psychromicrobium sp. YIM B11713]|uniref:SDR family NAD(P)-dependent oxidoreductase n=1 Tax=Psychromicrobium sp. YIM B11713 TaxID=3145233 RepID=UPI00374EE61E
MRFSDQVVIVTGGAHGIGHATARRFLSEGARVAILDSDPGAATELVTEWAGAALAVPCDVLSTESVEQAISAVLHGFGRIDVLASVAGGEIPTVDPLEERQWERVVDLNLHAPVRLIKACTPALRASRGAIVLVSSVNALLAFGGPGYSSAKAGLGILAKNLAVTLGSDGVRINVVAPGTVRTRAWSKVPGGADKMLPFCPLGRVGEPEDIASAIAFLASSDASWITGVTLPVDGGQTTGPLTAIRGFG